MQPQRTLQNYPLFYLCPLLYPTYPLEQDWGAFYVADPDWLSPWNACNDPTDEWPLGYRLSDYTGTPKLLRDNRICVPNVIAPCLMAALHSQIGHLGLNRAILEWRRRYNLTPSLPLIPLARRITRSCPVCQACDPPNWQVQGPISPNPVPPPYF